MLAKVLILFIVSFAGIGCIIHSFPIKYIGNEYSVEEYKKFNLCLSQICLRDAKRIIAHATYRKNTDPCHDMEEFACGHFFEYRPTNDRYEKIGFENELERQYEYYLKRILKEKILKEEPKIFKIIKSYFQKCVSSDYVKVQGKAEIFSLLSKFGKFPALEENWHPSDFNLTKALLSQKELYFDIKQCYKQVCFDVDIPDTYSPEAVREMLHFALGLSDDVTKLIVDDYKDFINSSNKSYVETTVRDFDSRFNVTTGLNWIEIIKALNITIDNTKIEDYRIFYRFEKDNYVEFLDLKNRRRIANVFMVEFLMDKVVFFSVYPKPDENKRALNRYETCIEAIQSLMNFPLEVMFELNFAEQVDKTALKDFMIMTLLMSFDSIDEKITKELKDSITNTSVYIGFPDEFTSLEFLDILYANLNLTGYEGVYKMHQDIKSFRENLMQQGYESLYMDGLSEDKKLIFELRFEHKPLQGNNLIVFKIKDIIYPIFHPDRPYFVNLAFFHEKIFASFWNHVENYFTTQLSTPGSESIQFDAFNMQKNYKKYVETFGAEENLPGFLLSNEQVLYMILYQSKCSKKQDGSIETIHFPSKNIFSCSVNEI